MASAGKGEGSGRTILQLAVVAMIALVAVGLMINPGKPWSPSGQPVRHITITTFDPDPKQGVAPEQQARKERSVARLTELGVPWTEDLPVIPGEAGLRSRTNDEVARRCVAAMLCTLKASASHPTPVAGLIKAWSALGYFSPRELTYVTTPEPSPDALAQHGRRGEAVHVLLWALGYVPLAAPDVPADPEASWELMRGKGPEAFGKAASMRSLGEVFDAADLYYRLRGAVLEARRKGQPLEKVDAEVISERHRTLNWLTRLMNAEWDDVPTDR